RRGVLQAKQIFSEALGVMLPELLAGHTLADCLDWLASVADAEGRPRAAAVSFGAAGAQWQASGAIRYAPERAAYSAEVALRCARRARPGVFGRWLRLTVSATVGRTSERERR